MLICSIIVFWRANVSLIFAGVSGAGLSAGSNISFDAWRYALYNSVFNSSTLDKYTYRLSFSCFGNCFLILRSSNTSSSNSLYFITLSFNDAFLNVSRVNMASLTCIFSTKSNKILGEATLRVMYFSIFASKRLI